MKSKIRKNRNYLAGMSPGMFVWYEKVANKYHFTITWFPGVTMFY